jgi:hypothetical protein
MNQSIGKVALNLLPIFSVGAFFIYLKTRGFSRACSDVSIRFWALSCAWHAFGVEYRRILRVAQADIERLDATRRQQRALEPQSV